MKVNNIVVEQRGSYRLSKDTHQYEWANTLEQAMQ